MLGISSEKLERLLPILVSGHSPNDKAAAGGIARTSLFRTALCQLLLRGGLQEVLTEGDARSRDKVGVLKSINVLNHEFGTNGRWRTE